MRMLGLDSERLRRFLLRRTQIVAAGLVLFAAALLVAFIAAEVPLLPAAHRAADPAAAEEASPAVEVVDTDHDALPDIVENYLTGTNATLWDSRGDGIPDGWLWAHGYDPRDRNISLAWAEYPGPGEAPDVYGLDGLAPRYRMTLLQAYRHGRPPGWAEAKDGPNPEALDPRRWESASGLPVPWLLYYGLPLDQGRTDVVNSTTAQTGRRFTVEEAYESDADPRAYDSDGDGLADVDERDAYRTDPSRFSTSGSGVPDGWLVRHGLELEEAAIAFQDPDNDGLTTLHEYLYNELRLGRPAAVAGGGLSPGVASSAGSGLPDGWLVRMGIDPLDAAIGATVIASSTQFDLRPGGPAPPPALVAPHVTLTVRDAYTYARPGWWSEPKNGVWWGGLSGAKQDTDDDGLPDVVEIRGWVVSRKTEDGLNETEWSRVDSDPRLADTDADGLLDTDEFRGKTAVRGTERRFPPTDPRRPDSDFDGLSDEFEATTRVAPGMAGDPGLDPMDADSDDDRFDDGEEWRYWSAKASAYAAPGTRYGYEHSSIGSATEWLAALPWVREQGAGGGMTAATLVAPGGDADRDGLANVLDPDSDGDTLLDGWEADPTLYRESPYASALPRAATDPANPDTDGDRLPDAWETRFGIYDPALGGWNLDPARWSSLGTGLSDDATDLDGDGIVWYAYDRSVAGFARVPHDFVATNFQEFVGGTDPNRADSSGDGLPDGWKIFWGRVYPSLPLSELGAIYPGSPGDLVFAPDAVFPDPATRNDAATTPFAYQRLAAAPDPIPAWGEATGAPATFVDAFGNRVTTYLFRGEVPYSFLTHWQRRTNPYLGDSDGDGMPDAWEILANVNAPASGGLDPTVWDATTDPDGDGLNNLGESQARTDPFRADTDAGGVSDAKELAVAGRALDPLNGADDRSLLDATADTDGDEVPDSTEIFRLQTNASSPDTDHDGLLDGPDVTIDPATKSGADRVLLWKTYGIRLVPAGASVVARGEEAAGTDPTDWDTNGDGIPDGWHDAYPGATRDYYRYCRPQHWDEASMGVWWWGLDPTMASHDPGAPPTDLDRDGLADMTGEDTLPCANPDARLARGSPWAPGLPASERLLRGQAYGFDLAKRAALEARDAGVTNGVPDVRDRARTRLVLDTIDGEAPLEEGSAPVSKGRPSRVTGRLFVDERAADGTLLNPAGTPVPDATVVVAINRRSQAYGIGFTDADGRFDVAFALAPQHGITIPRPGMVALSQDQGEVTWATDPSGIHTGLTTDGAQNGLFVYSYNTSASVPMGHPTFYAFTARLQDAAGRDTTAVTHGVSSAASLRVPIDVTSGASLTIRAPSVARNGASIAVAIALADDGGTPLPGRHVRVGWDDVLDRDVVTSGNGTTQFTLTAGFGAPGPHLLQASFAGDASSGIGPGSAEIPVLVKNVPRLIASLEPPSPAVGESVLVRGSLLDGPRPIRGAPVRLSGALDATGITGDDGRFTVATPIAPQQGPGARTVLVGFEGSETHMAARAQLNVTIHDRAVLDSVAATPAPRGGSTTVEGRLLDSAQRPLSGRGVRFALASGPEFQTLTDEHGRFKGRILIPAGISPGAVPLVVAFAGEPSYDGAQERVDVLVTSTTSLAVGPAAGVRGRGLVVDGRLLDDESAGLANRRVELVQAGRRVAAATTDPAGAFRLDWPLPLTIPLVPLELQVRFNGTADGALLPSVLALRAPVRDGVEIRLDPHVLRRGHNGWSGALVTDGGRPAPGLPVAVSIDSAIVGHAVTGPDGRFTVSFEVEREAPLMEHGTAATFGGSDTLAAASVQERLPLVAATSLRVDAPRRLVVGTGFDVAGAVVDDAGHAVEGGMVHARLAAADIRTAGPISNGRYHLTLKAPAETGLGATTLALEYPGDRFHLRAAVEWPVDVVEAVVLSVELPRTTEPGRVYSAAVTLTTSAGRPIREAPIFVDAPGAAPPHFVLTDDAGRAIVPVRTDVAGSFAFNMSFAGSATLAPTSADASTIAGFGPPAVPWVIAAVLVAVPVLLACAAVLVGTRWRRRARAIGSILDEALDALLHGADYRRSIVMAYRRFEEIVSLVGVAQAPSRTAREVADQVQQIVPFASSSAGALVAAFERALYDSGEPTAAHRLEAIEALRAVRREVRSILSGGRPDEGASA